MKSILTILLAFCTFTLFSQARLGKTKREIVSEFSELAPETGYDSNGNSYIDVEMTRAHVRYFIDPSSGLCNLTLILPKSQAALNYYVELYNSRYVIISPTKWRMYTVEGSIAEVELLSQNESSCFVWQ